MAQPDVTEELIESFATDGVALLRQVFDPTWMELVDRCAAGDRRSSAGAVVPQVWPRAECAPTTPGV